MSLFKALYGLKPMIPSNILPIVDSLGPDSAEAVMELITKEPFRLQTIASALLSAFTSCKSTAQSNTLPDISSYDLSSLSSSITFAGRSKP